jgi:hypothetical protein
MVSPDTFVFANSHFSGINKGDTRAFTETDQFQKQCKRNRDFSLRFNKSIVRRQIGKFSVQIFCNIKQIKMFQIAKTAAVKANHNGNNLCTGHG